MKGQCVRKRDKVFISLKNKYNVSSATLENAIHSWYKDSDNVNYASNEFNSYLEDYLCLSNTPYTSKAKYDKAHKVWEDVITKYSTFNEDKIKVVKTMATLLFDEGDFAIYETAKPGVYTLKIKEPVYKQSSQTEKALSKKEITLKDKKNNNSFAPKVSLSTTGYRKGDPQKHPNINYVFTENAEAFIASHSFLPYTEPDVEFPYKGKPKLNVSDVGGTNQAGIRTDSKGNISLNAYGIVVKKYQQDVDGRFVAKEGQFQDTDEDFDLFVSLNEDMFIRLSESPNKEIVFPTQMGLGKAALPKRFAEWLQGQLLERFGIVSEIKENNRSNYDGYGLKLISIKNTEEADKLSNAEYKKAEYSYKEGELKGTLAITSSNNEITLAKDFTLDYFFDYISGKIKSTTSEQKRRVFEKLSKLGYTIDRIKGIINTVEKAKKLLLYHEFSHIFNNDREVYWKQGKDYLTEDKVDIETRATLDALIRLEEELSNDKLSESRTLVQQIIEDSKRRITFYKETHTYIVDGKKADTSVTQYIHGKKDIGAWGLPSSILGTTVDEVTRDYFSGKLKKSYPNLTKSQRDNLISDLDRLREQLDTKFGKGNYEVITTEFPIASKYTVTEKNGKRTTKVMAGTMDMLIYDNEGNFYIYDMKTSRSGIKENTKVGYSKQLSLYKSILEANYPQLKGKIKELNLIEFSLRYPDPNDVTYYEASQIENGIEGQLYVEDEEGDIINIQDSSDYTSPRLKTTIPIGESRMIELEALDSADRAIIEEEVGTKPVSSDEYTPSKSTMQRIGWDNSPLLTATEKRFLSNQLMKLSSFIISHLQSSSEANKHYFGNTYKVYDFTKMSRNEIIETIGIGNIFNYIKEEFYNPNNRLDIDDFDTLDKLQVAYDNFEAMAKQGYSKLIALEDITVLSAKPEFIKREDIEESLGEEVEQGSLEEREREYWQIGQRQLSVKASLSSTIRRLFERLPVVDQNGNPIKDEFGFNMDTFVDSGEAINSILTWVNAATTIEEMESILSEMAPANPWLNNILEAIKEEPVRSQFFQNFRKDFLTYSVVRVEYDSNGNRQYVVDTINTQGAAKTILNNTVTSFKLGLMTNLIIPIRGDLEGRGRVNVESVKSLKESVSKITKSIQSSFEGTDRKAINSNINELAEVLSRVGLPITPAILKTAFASDVRSKNYSATKVGKVLTQLSYMLDTLLDNKGNTEYGPLMKGSEGNIYGNYKNIVNVLSPYIQDSVESSTYENGKMYYSFTTPSYMGKLVNKLSNKLGDSTKFEKFIEQEYGSYKWFKQGNVWNCPWLDRITSSESVRQGLQHKVQLTFDRTNYTDLSELSYTLSLMQEYFYDKNKKWAWFRLPILANKPSSEFVRFERLSGRNYQTKIKKGLRKVFNQELMRMRTVLERADNPDIEKIGAKGKVWFDIKSIDPKVAAKFKKGKLTLNDLVKDGKYIFSGSGAEFKFLSPINLEIINKTELGQLIVDKLNGKDVNESNLDKLFYQAVDVFMARQMEVERANWERLGLFETEEVTRKIDGKEVTKKKYKYVSQLGNSLEEINANLEEYVWNDMFATINIIELTATDLAYYKNVEDFQKRYSQVHAPSMRLNVTAKDDKGVLYSADGFERTVYLKDSIAKSDIIANVAKVFNDKIATLRGAQKRDMEIMRDLILTEFENINVADAQGYSSPTSYRKKMGMQGKWTPEMEEAYRQIREGNLNINNLGVVWQPLKPFVYSQIRKTSGATTMSELKVPVQNKNSEYLLLIADAIMRSGKQVNKLQAIFDFMEDSAYDNGEYNGKGIDTVQFISAVNSGGMGAIDINSAESYEEVKSLLEEAAYYHKDKSTTSDNDNDRYNEQYVHTIPFEDYGIQQEVPAHLSDHKQAMGSQVRILSVSDISSNARFIIGNEEYDRDRLHKEYFDLIAENIKDSYEKLKKDLGLSGSRIEQNKKLSALLQETILKDQRYGADLLKACSLDEKGEFVIPPSDPIQSTRIQQLLNSIIKNRINKQKVQGGPAVQASVFGLSDDLHIIWQDKDGNLLQTREEFKGTDAQYNKYVKENQHSVAFFECYAPIPSKDIEMALLKPDGTYMTPQEAVAKKIITDEMLKAIGYRIPTEDKYSIIPLKIKGFVPKAAGEAIIMPKEITKTTGADFD